MDSYRIASAARTPRVFVVKAMTTSTDTTAHRGEDYLDTFFFMPLICFMIWMASAVGFAVLLDHWVGLYVGTAIALVIDYKFATSQLAYWEKHHS